MGKLFRLLWESLVKVGLEEGWKWLGGKILMGVAGGGAILTLALWCLSFVGWLNRAWANGWLVGFLVSIAVVFLSFVAHVIQGRQKAQLSTGAALTPAEPQDSVLANTPPILTKSRREIADEIASWPLAQQGEAAKHYVGLRVEWEGTLRSIAPGWGRPMPGRVSLLLSCGGRLIDTYAEILESPEIHLLKGAARLRLEGTISQVRIDAVILNPAKIVSVLSGGSLEAQGQGKDKTERSFVGDGVQVITAELIGEASGTSLEIELQLENDGQYNGQSLYLWFTGPIVAGATIFHEYLGEALVPLSNGGYSPKAGPSDRCVQVKLRESPDQPIKRIRVRVFSHVPISLLRAEWH